ncbi:MAG: hypothetical protein HY269_03755 [Deltaproteobacteria bacterium]|nr:hypothetical protein [Deltaproteobacteria bacterium]
MLSPIIPPEDFWSRQANAQKFSFDFAPFGVPTEITANDPTMLVAAQLSSRRFSRATEPGGKNIHLQIVVGKRATAPVPADLPERLAYSGLGDWITISAGEWGQGFANLQTRAALVFLSPALAEDTRLVSRYFIDHYLLNFLITEWAMLHASCVLDPTGKHLIIMVAPHNTGKSTTALHLLRAGYSFLADGMALLQLRSGRLIVGGYPVGEVKLRDDVLASFPEYSGETVKVREHLKTVVDLRAMHARQMADTLFAPPHIQMCFVERGAASATSPLAPDEAMRLLTPNTVFWDEAARLEHNTATLHHLLQVASLHQLTIGPDPAELIATMEALT